MKSLKYLKYIVISGTIVLSIGNIAKGQYIPGTVDMMPSMNATTTNAITAARTRILSGNSAAAERAEASRIKAIEQRGAQIIKAGKATLQFTSSSAGTLTLVKSLTFDKTEPQTLSGQIILVQGYVNRFNQLIPKMEYQVNNINDGFALSYLIAYKAYYNKNPEMDDVQKMRQIYGEAWLVQPYYQGLPNAEKQYTYERWALMAMQASDEREKVRTSLTRQERQEAEERAKMFAKYVLNDKR